MQKKTILALLAMLALSTPVYSIELPAGAMPTFDKSSTGYASAYEFNQILEAYGLKLAPEAVSGVPTSYAKVKGDKIRFNDDSTAYTPAQYHSILTAYGLELSPEAVREKLGAVSSYAKVKNDKIVFGNDSIAYGGSEWKTILSAYSLPMVAAPAPVPVPAPKMVMPMDSDHDGVTDDKDACPGTPMGVAVDERGCWAMSSGLLFDVNKAVIKKEFYPALDKTKKIFDDYPTMKVQVEGHCDNTGTDAYNQMLSEKRAQAVVDYLVNSVGIDASRLKAVGYGESKPAYSNATKEGRAKNRRVEFTPMM
jgi:OmpA-OmpF porin, OOP family